MVWVFVFAFILSAVNWLSEFYSEKIERFHTQLISFSAGLFITFIFLVLLPEFFEGFELAGNYIYIFLLVGFVLFHFLEKFLYQHIKNKDELLRDLAGVHAIGFFFDHFIVGIALYFAFTFIGTIAGMILFIPLLLHTFSSSISLTQIDAYFNKNKFLGLILSAAPFIGTLTAYLLIPKTSIYYALFSFVIGALLYIVIRDMLPSNEKGDLRFFFAGFIIGLLTQFFAVSLV